jgi:hypothetical protein
MKSCQIYGDMLSNLSSENYLTVTICDQCIKDEEESIQNAVKNGEEDMNTSIINESDYDPIYGDECYLCGKSKDEEDLENN